MSRPLIFAIFFAIVLAVLVLGSVMIFEAAASVFGISTIAELWWLGGALAVFSGSFVASIFLGMRYWNAFTRGYCTFSAVWIGFFVYFVLVSGTYGIIVIFSGLLLQTFGKILFTLAIIVGVYGLIHARRISICNVSLKLPNLPEAWRARKIVWVSDLHLGQLHGAPYAEKICAKILSLNPDIVFIGGDLFDGTGAPDIAELIAPLKNISPKLGTYFITGNHEEFGDPKNFIAAIRAAGIRVLMDEKVEIDDIQIIGVDYENASERGQFREILARCAIDSEKLSILLKHEPKDLDITEQAGINLQLSGHTHRAQLWPLNYVARLSYKGFSYGLKQFKRMYVHISSGAGTWGPPMRVGTNSEVVLFTFK